MKSDTDRCLSGPGRRTRSDRDDRGPAGAGPAGRRCGAGRAARPTPGVSSTGPLLLVLDVAQGRDDAVLLLEQVDHLRGGLQLAGLVELHLSGDALVIQVIDRLGDRLA